MDRTRRVRADVRGLPGFTRAAGAQDLGSTLLVSADVPVMQRRERWIPIPNFFIVTESIFRTMRRHLYFPPLLFYGPRGRDRPLSPEGSTGPPTQSRFAATGLFRTFAQL